MANKKEDDFSDKVISLAHFFDNPEKLNLLRKSAKSKQEQKGYKQEDEQECYSISTDEYNLDILAETVWDQLAALEKTIEFLAQFVQLAGNNNEKESFQEFGRALKNAVDKFKYFWESAE